MSRFMQVYEPVEEFIIISTPSGNAVDTDEENVKRVLSNSKVQKYIHTQCDIIYNNIKKQNPSTVKKLPSGIINNIKKRISTFKDNTIVNMIQNPSAGFFNVGGYTICAYGNAISMTSVKVILYIEAEDQYSVTEIPDPKDNTLRDLGYHKDTNID